MPELPETMLLIWVYLFSKDLSKNIYQFGPWKNSGGPLFTKGAKSEPHRAHLGIHLGVHEGQEE